MKSNACKIVNGNKDLAAILKESEKVAVYNELTHKQTLQLRLICEEVDGMLPNILGSFEGELTIEFVDGVCKVIVSVEFDEFTAEKKKELVSVAKNKKNAAAVGIVGKIRSVIENVFLDEEIARACGASSSVFQMATGYSEGIDYSYIWSLSQYRATVQPAEKPEEWDELEKSVIAAVADDVIVGVKGKKADIIVIKKFA